MPENAELGAAGILRRSADSRETVDCERSVPDPCVPIIPVSFASDVFRKAAGGSRDKRARRLERQKLHDQRRAFNHFAPASGVGGSGEPVPPIKNRVPEQVHLFPLVDGQTAVGILRNFTQDEYGRLAFVQRELGPDPVLVWIQWDFGGKPKLEIWCSETNAAGGDVRTMGFSGKVEGGLALNAEGERSSDDTDAADQAMDGDSWSRSAPRT